jgi:hypothetical protein
VKELDPDKEKEDYRHRDGEDEGAPVAHPTLDLDAEEGEVEPAEPWNGSIEVDRRGRGVSG